MALINLRKTKTASLLQLPDASGAQLQADYAAFGDIALSLVFGPHVG